MIMELATETPHAYVPFHPAVKSSQPHDCCSVYTLYNIIDILYVYRMTQYDYSAKLCIFVELEKHFVEFFLFF